MISAAFNKCVRCRCKWRCLAACILCTFLSWVCGQTCIGGDGNATCGSFCPFLPSPVFSLFPLFSTPSLPFLYLQSTLPLLDPCGACEPSCHCAWERRHSFCCRNGSATISRGRMCGNGKRTLKETLILLAGERGRFGLSEVPRCLRQERSCQGCRRPLVAWSRRICFRPQVALWQAREV